MTRKLFRGAGIIAMASLAASLALAGPASAAPPGNNGTIKIDGEPFENHPNNEPHVGCTFHVDFYGFDDGDLYADVIFEAQAPSGSGEILRDRVFIGEDDNSGGGSAAGLDASVEYSLDGYLNGLTEHPLQGYHIELTIHADGAQGADVKHKTFWVTGCEPCQQPPEEQQTN